MEEHNICREAHEIASEFADCASGFFSDPLNKKDADDLSSYIYKNNPEAFKSLIDLLIGNSTFFELADEIVKMTVREGYQLFVFEVAIVKGGSPGLVKVFAEESYRIAAVSLLISDTEDDKFVNNLFYFQKESWEKNRVSTLNIVRTFIKSGYFIKGGFNESQVNAAFIKIQEKLYKMAILKNDMILFLSLADRDINTIPGSVFLKNIMNKLLRNLEDFISKENALALMMTVIHSGDYYLRKNILNLLADNGEFSKIAIIRHNAHDRDIRHCAAGHLEQNVRRIEDPYALAAVVAFGLSEKSQLAAADKLITMRRKDYLEWIVQTWSRSVRKNSEVDKVIQKALKELEY